MIHRWRRLIAVFVIALLAFPTWAFADGYQVDGDQVSPGNQNNISYTVDAGKNGSVKGQIVISWSGNNHLSPGTRVTFVLDAGQSTLPGVSVTPVTLTVPDNWSKGASISGESTVSFPAPPASNTYTVKWKTADSFPSNTLGGAAALNISVTVNAPPSGGGSGQSAAPTITVSNPFGITLEATSPAGAVATWTATASDGSTPACTPPSGSTFPLGTTQVTCSSNGGSATFSVTVQDTTPPTIIGSRDPASGNANGWNNTNVTVSFSCSDSGSGVKNCPGPTTLSNDGAGQSVTGTAVDNAGNSASATVGGINIDKTPPTVTYSGNAGSYTVDQNVGITCTAADNLSSLASNTCQNVSGPAYNFNLGANNLSATATDKAGNPGSGSTSFTVQVTYGSLCNLTKQFVTQAGIANSLCVKLNAAGAAAARGNASAKAGALGAYKNEISAQAGKALSAAQAAILTRLASAL